MFPFLVKSNRDPLFPPERKGGTFVLMQQLEYKLCVSLCGNGLFSQTPNGMEQCEQQPIEKGLKY